MDPPATTTTSYVGRPGAPMEPYVTASTPRPVASTSSAKPEKEKKSSRSGGTKEKSKKKEKNASKKDPSTTTTINRSTPYTTSGNVVSASSNKGTVSDGISSMKLSELKKELKGYGIPTGTFVEKSEFVSALQKARSERADPVKQTHIKKTKGMSTPSSPATATTYTYTNTATSPPPATTKSNRTIPTARTPRHTTRAFQQSSLPQELPQQTPQQAPQSFTKDKIVGTWETSAGQVTTYHPNNTFVCEIPYYGTMTGTWTNHGNDSYTCKATDGTLSTFKITMYCPGLMEIKFTNGEVYTCVPRTAADAESVRQLNQQLNDMNAQTQQMNQNLNATLGAMNAQTQQMNQNLYSSLGSMNAQTQQMNQNLYSSLGSMNAQTQQMQQGLGNSLHGMASSSSSIPSSSGHNSSGGSMYAPPQQQGGNKPDSMAQKLGEFAGGFVSGFMG